MSFAEQFISVIEGIVDTDINTLGNFRFILAMRKALVNRQFPDKAAESIIAQMKIEIDGDLITDDQIQRLTVGYASVMANMRDELKKNGFTHAEDFVVQAAATMSASLK